MAAALTSMSLLALLAATAQAAPADPMYQRLLGEEGPIEASAPLGPEPPAQPVAVETPSTDAALITADSAAGDPIMDVPPADATAFSVGTAGPSTGGLALLGLVGLAGAAWYTRRRLSGRFTPGADRPITVLGRQPLSASSALILIAVDDGDGGTRRLLVGTGSGAPSLVADIGGDFTGGLADLDSAAFGLPAQSAQPAQEIFHPVATTPAPTKQPAQPRAAAPKRQEEDRSRRSAELQRRAAPIREVADEAPPRVVMPPANAVARAYGRQPRSAEPPEPPLELPRRTRTSAKPRAAQPRAAKPRTGASRQPPARRVSEAEMNRARSLVDEVLSERLQSRPADKPERRIRGVA